MALRVSELVGLKVDDVYDGEKVKSYVSIRAETANASINEKVEVVRYIVPFKELTTKGEKANEHWKNPI